MVQVQVRVDERNTPQFSRMAYLAGVSPPITAEELKEIELSRAAKRESVSRKKSHAFDDEGQPSMFDEFCIDVDCISVVFFFDIRSPAFTVKLSQNTIMIDGIKCIKPRFVVWP